jgi:hypothetical protein
VDDYFLCVCVCDSIFTACVGALICETKLSLLLLPMERRRHMEKELER